MHLLCQIIPGDETSGIRSKFIIEEEKQGSEEGQGSAIAKGDVHGVAAADNAVGESPECCVSLTDYPGAAKITTKCNNATLTEAR